MFIHDTFSLHNYLHLSTANEKLSWKNTTLFSFSGPMLNLFPLEIIPVVENIIQQEQMTDDDTEYVKFDDNGVPVTAESLTHERRRCNCSSVTQAAARYDTIRYEMLF